MAKFEDLYNATKDAFQAVHNDLVRVRQDFAGQQIEVGPLLEEGGAIKEAIDKAIANVNVDTSLYPTFEDVSKSINDGIEYYHEQNPVMSLENVSDLINVDIEAHKQDTPHLSKEELKSYILENGASKETIESLIDQHYKNVLHLTENDVLEIVNGTFNGEPTIGVNNELLWLQTPNFWDNVEFSGRLEDDKYIVAQNEGVDNTQVVYCSTGYALANAFTQLNIASVLSTYIKPLDLKTYSEEDVKPTLTVSIHQLWFNKDGEKIEADDKIFADENNHDQELEWSSVLMRFSVIHKSNDTYCPGSLMLIVKPELFVVPEEPETPETPETPEEPETPITGGSGFFKSEPITHISIVEEANLNTENIYTSSKPKCILSKRDDANISKIWHCCADTTGENEYLVIDHSFAVSDFSLFEPYMKRAWGVKLVENDDFVDWGEELEENENEVEVVDYVDTLVPENDFGVFVEHTTKDDNEYINYYLVIKCSKLKEIKSTHIEYGIKNDDDTAYFPHTIDYIYVPPVFYEGNDDKFHMAIFMPKEQCWAVKSSELKWSLKDNIISCYDTTKYEMQFAVHNDVTIVDPVMSDNNFEEDSLINETTFDFITKNISYSGRAPLSADKSKQWKLMKIKHERIDY